MKVRHRNPEIHAGSMADIAFLLLIFFLVTTVIESDAGIDRKLPDDRLDRVEIIKPERNILKIFINADNELLCEEERIALDVLKDRCVAFIDNGGISSSEEGYCDYCSGNRLSDSSDNPLLAVISLSHARETQYATYIAVQNEISAAYMELRDRLALKKYGISYSAMEEVYNNPFTSESRRKAIEAQLLQIRELYPLNLSEALIESR